MVKIEDYESFVGEKEIRTIRELCSDVDGKSMVHVNSTYYGGGVAEMLNSYVPLLNSAGLNTEWRLLKGGKEFFAVTKKMHNSLQGGRDRLTRQDIRLYEETLDAYADFTNLSWYDCVVIDDPQPCGLITHYTRESPSLWKPLPVFMNLLRLQKKQPWVWRCHIDISERDPRTWHYLRNYLERYDSVIISSRKYRTGLDKPHFIMPPAIDPLSPKNAGLKDRQAERLLSRHGIDLGKPIVAQVSRFDPWKDPLGVIEAFKLVRQKVPCQLVLVGNPAADDPQGEEVFREVFRKTEGDKDIKLICLQSDLLVNAVQRKASVVIQKSLREGFGLTVSEALWKGTPVVASRVGGIPLQIDNGRNGFLVDGIRECADRTTYLLRNPKKAQRMGELGMEKVRANFLITRLVKDEIAMFRKTTAASESVATRVPREMVRRMLAVPEFALSLPLSALDTFGKVGSKVRSTVRSTTGI